MTPHMVRTLEGFHHLMIGRLMGKLPRCRADGNWNEPPLSEAMREVGLEEMEVYIGRINKTVAQYIATRPIMYLYLDT